MGVIKTLDHHVANLIAAGEVVEHLVNIVKELVENSIDANSTHITVRLEDHGLKRISVIDNGSGMDKEDLISCTHPHATSKIKTEHDLFHIDSLGFRGEALASIASVSKMTIKSHFSGASYQVYIEQGTISKPERTAFEMGTQIDIQSVFYNTPARLKHIAHPSAELSMIRTFIFKVALAYPNRTFELIHDDKTLIQTTGSGDIKRIFLNQYDVDIVKSLTPFEASNHLFKINGLYADPRYYRSNTRSINIILNKRVIENTVLQKGITEAFKSYLPIHKYPIMYLNIELDPMLVDVNIHPQKQDVKITEVYQLRDLIIESIKDVLTQQNHILRIAPKETEYKETLDEGSLFTEETPRDYNQDENVKESPKEPLNNDEPKKKLPELDYIGQYKGTYLLFQNKDGLYLIDQHAAAERIRYERYRTLFGSVEIVTTDLLIPLQVVLDKTSVELLTNRLDETKKIGLKCMIVDNIVYINQVPSFFPRGMETVYAEEVLDHLLNKEDFSVESIRNQLAIDLSCKHSIKANDFINESEVNSLLKDLNDCENPYKCPHGRPTIIHFTPEEIERLFERIQL
jgi:DNA mismatch repair protein MutL